MHRAQNKHSIFLPLLQYLHNGHINLYVLDATKHFNMVNAFKGASTNKQFFWQALCTSIAYF